MMTRLPIPETVIEQLAAASHVAVLTGAGVSAESGIPTFRSPGGLWKTFKPEQLATPEAFASDPATVWEWYRHRRRIIAESAPNAGHQILAAWEKHFAHFCLVTQNVDNLHSRAGSRNICELHGNIFRSRCHSCGKAADDTASEADSEIPRCACGGLIRPEVVWFGEALPTPIVEKAWNAVALAEVFLSVGTAGVVFPAAGLVEVARRGGAFLIEINPEETEMSPLFDVTLRGASGIILPAIAERLGEPSLGH
jgi:NAD-dependent deacetylase